MDDVRIDSLWTLRDLREPHERWLLYLNQQAAFESEAVRNLFYNSGRPSLTLRDHDGLEAQARALVDEIRAQLVPPPKVDGFQPQADLSALTHYPSGRWMDARHPIGRLRWTRELSLGGKPLQPGTDSDHVEIASLSDIAQTAIRRFDAITVEASYRRHVNDLKEVSDVDPERLPPPRKAAVFIAYRRPHLATAKSVHDQLSRYASGSAFTPYLDFHDMGIGPWMEQLLEHITNADIFMPLVTDDYAAPGSVGAKEIEHAKQVAADRGLKTFFAPILASRHPQPAAAFLRDHHGHVEHDLNGLSAGSQALNQFFGRVLTEVLSREFRSA